MSSSVDGGLQRSHRQLSAAALKAQARVAALRARDKGSVGALLGAVVPPVAAGPGPGSATVDAIAIEAAEQERIATLTSRQWTAVDNAIVALLDVSAVVDAVPSALENALAACNEARAALPAEARDEVERTATTSSAGAGAASAAAAAHSCGSSDCGHSHSHSHGHSHGHAHGHPHAHPHSHPSGHGHGKVPEDAADAPGPGPVWWRAEAASSLLACAWEAGYGLCLAQARAGRTADAVNGLRDLLLLPHKTKGNSSRAGSDKGGGSSRHDAWLLRGRAYAGAKVSL
jgi:hypothetical protein